MAIFVRVALFIGRDKLLARDPGHCRKHAVVLIPRGFQLLLNHSLRRCAAKSGRRGDLLTTASARDRAKSRYCATIRIRPKITPPARLEKEQR